MESLDPLDLGIYLWIQYNLGILFKLIGIQAFRDSIQGIQFKLTNWI